MKTVNRYQIRYYKTENSYSDYVGFRGRLVEFKKAVKIVRRLKKSGINAFYEKWEINI